MEKKIKLFPEVHNFHEGDNDSIEWEEFIIVQGKPFTPTPFFPDSHSSL